jgi:hypothetical protein
VANCSKCGAEISSEQQICAACGTPVAAAQAAFQPVQPVAQQAPVAYAAPIAAAPVKSGPSALKIILIIVAVIFGMGVLGLGALGYFAYRVAKSAHVDEKNGTVSMNGFGMNMNSADNLTAADLGVDIYPGAEQEKGGVKMTIAGTSSVVGKFATSDSKDAVFAFYRDKLGADATTFNFANSATLSQKKSDQETVTVTIRPSSSPGEGKTQISIQHTKKN